MAGGGTTLVVPLPIVFEVFKWLLNRVDVPTSRTALTWMLEDLHVVYLGPVDLDEMSRLMAMRPTWPGSLEDTSVALVALRMSVPVWTIDYEDLSAFPNLQFWNPG